MTPRDAFDLYQAKAGCSYPGPQRTAHRCFATFAPLLTLDERRALSTAVSHVLIGEGRAELDAVCGRIRWRVWRCAKVSIVVNGPPMSHGVPRDFGRAAAAAGVLSQRRARARRRRQ